MSKTNTLRSAISSAFWAGVLPRPSGRVRRGLVALVALWSLVLCADARALTVDAYHEVDRYGFHSTEFFVDGDAECASGHTCSGALTITRAGQPIDRTEL